MGDLTPRQRSSRCILLPQPTGQVSFSEIKWINYVVLYSAIFFYASSNWFSQKCLRKHITVALQDISKFVFFLTDLSSTMLGCSLSFLLDQFPRLRWVSVARDLHAEQWHRNKRVQTPRTIVFTVIFSLYSFFQMSRKIYVFVPFYHIYQPLRSGRIWHKINF